MLQQRGAISPARCDAKPKPTTHLTKGGYVESGRPMPTSCKSEVKIIASMELTELACAQMGLKPPVTKLAERPRSYNVNGWVREGNKWVAGLAVYNDGMLKSATSKIGRQL